MGAMDWKPDVTVAAVIERDGRYLLVQERIAGQLVFNQPAGHVHGGESLIAAVVRETLEETAFHFTPEWLLGVYPWVSARGHDTLRFAFSGRLGAHEQRALDAPVVATHWLARPEIAALGASLRTPLVLRCIDDYLAGRRITLGVLSDPIGA